jgi:SAM-dependent methyltransferase
MALPRLRLPGVSWKHPLVDLAAHALDPVDSLVRAARGAGHLPRYSVRIRSNGLRRQFGGGRFLREGRTIRELLIDLAGLAPTSDVLEIGCGCGRTAHALAGWLEPGRYTGVDVERVALAACERSAALGALGFHFAHMDVANREYNPGGATPAARYRFPWPDASFDVVFLISVFTHMLADDVTRYVEEICRLLRPGGRCLLSTFLLDHGRDGRTLSFPHELGPARLERADLPEIAVAYPAAFFLDAFRRHGAVPRVAPRLGTWRAGPPLPDLAFGQDVLVFERSPLTAALR